MPPVVVFDTNILLSALFSLQGSPFRALALAQLGVVQSVTCAAILDEFAAKLQHKFDYPLAHVQAAVAEVGRWSRLVAIPGTLHVIAADPADDKILECAVIGKADYIVTGDRRHLLPLGTYEGITIIGATELLTRLAG